LLDVREEIVDGCLTGVWCRGVGCHGRVAVRPAGRPSSGCGWRRSASIRCRLRRARAA
jgi:hypothetical protein